VVGFPLDNAVLWLGLPTAIAGVWVLHGWCQRGCIAVWLLVIALVVLSMNLMAAGGISFAGVAQTWWLLLALTLNVFDATASPRHDAAGANPPIPDSEHRTPRLVLAGICFLSAGLAVACFRTMYNPVLLCQARLYEGREWESGNRPERAEAAYHAAAEADPHSVEPWTALATLYCGVLMRGGDSERSAQFENAIEQVLNRKGTSHSIQRQVGDWRLALFSAGRDPEQLRRAIRAYQDGVALYPNDNMGHAQLAWASYLAGNETAAEHEATEALRLDALTPHVERRLNQQTIYDPTGNGLTRQNGELVMRRLRR
jgi:tetratricopeptide (TPR) repeat protein